MKNKNGFTLIELLAVIIILGILMIIAIPSVTSYINSSRKSAYVDTAKQIVAGARNIVNDGSLEMFDTATTYYIPANYIKTENASKSPYGEFVEAYVGVTYNGQGYKYYWISVDETGTGVKELTPIDKLDEDKIESDIDKLEIGQKIENTGIGNRKTVKALEKNSISGMWEWNTTTENANTISEEVSDISTAATTVLTNAQKTNQLVSIGDNVYIFKGGNPSNYVRFNNETWRIVGVYDDQLKIIRTNLDIRHQFDYGSGADSIKYSASELREYLNGTYLNSLSQDKQLIDENGVWNVGEAKQNLNAANAYQRAKQDQWIGAIGIISTYEFLYATEDSACYEVAGSSYYSCGKKELDWMTPVLHDIWTLNPHYYEDDGSRGIPVNISASGYLSISSSNSSSLWILPSAYLKSSVKILSGDGTIDNPYVFN